MAKNYVLIMLTMVLGVPAAFAGGEDEGGGASLAVIMPNATHGFLGESIRHAENATRELAEAGGYEYQFLISDDVVEQSNQIDTVVAQGVRRGRPVAAQR